MKKPKNDWQYERIEIKQFDVENYGVIEVFFSHTEDLILISIPEWNWSFLWPLSDEDTIKDDQKHKDKLIKALSVSMLLEDAKEFTNKIDNYLYN